MSIKQKTLKLSYPHVHATATEYCYRVVAISDSIEYWPGQFLLKPEVEGLCQDPGWTVTMVVETAP